MISKQKYGKQMLAEEKSISAPRQGQDMVNLGTVSVSPDVLG